MVVWEFEVDLGGGVVWLLGGDDFGVCVEVYGFGIVDVGVVE